jgi:hypothetical protein
MGFSCLFILLLQLISLINGQKSVKLLQDTFEVTWTYKPNETDFTLKATIDSGITNAWIGLGFNQNGLKKMDGADVIICTNIAGQDNVRHYLNSGYSSDILDPSRPTLGITKGVTTRQGNVITCSYTRQNMVPTANYYNFKADSTPSLLVAFGELKGSTVGYHSKRDVVDFPLDSSTTAQPSTMPPSTVNSMTIQDVKVEWKANGADKTDFTITTSFNSNVNVNNAWVGLGFNNQQTMDKTNPIVCKSGNQNVIQHYYNTGYSSSLLNSQMPMIGITNSNVQINGPTFKCSFTRDNSNSNANYYNINNPAYLLIAFGTLQNSGEIQYHNVQGKSNQMISFVGGGVTQSTASTASTSTTSQSGETTKQPVNGLFSFDIWKLNYVNNGDYIDFVFETQLSSPENKWSAFAFSSDKSMGGDNVCMCKYTSATSSSIENYITNGKTVSLLDVNQPKLGFLNESIVYENGVLKCSFKRMKTMNTVNNFYDLTKEHYVLVATGLNSQSKSLIYNQK